MQRILNALIELGITLSLLVMGSALCTALAFAADGLSCRP
jgi:hypothetical protein